MIIVNDLKWVALSELEIQKQINEHSTASLKFLIYDQDLGLYESLLGQTLFVDHEEEGKKTRLIYASVDSLVIERTRDDIFVTLTAESLSRQQDQQPETQIYQDSQKKIADIVKALKLEGLTLSFMEKSVENQAMSEPVLRLSETKFMFLKRLAAAYEQPLIVDDISDSDPYLWIGRRQGKEISLDSPNQEYKLRKTLNQSSYELLSREYLEIGDSILREGQKLYVIRARISLDKGMLSCAYELVPEVEVKATRIPSPIAGCTLRGKVANNVDPEKKGRLQVDFGEADQLAGERYWYPYLSSYSGTRGGVYILPEVGDLILVCFPSDQEKDAYALASLRETEIQDYKTPDEQIIRNKFGQEIRLGEDWIELRDPKNEKLIALKQGNIMLQNKQATIVLKEDAIELSAKTIKLTAGSSKVELSSELILKGSRIRLN